MARRLGVSLREHWVILLGLLAVAALIIAVNPVKVGRSLAGADGRTVLLMVLVAVLLYLCHGVAWWFVLQGAGARVGLRESVRVVVISQAFDFLPGGDLWRIPIVKAEDGGALDAGILAATVVFDDLVYYLVLTMAMVPAAIRYPPLAIALAVALIPQVLIFGILLWPWLNTWLVGQVSRIGPVRRFEPQLALLGPCFRRLFTRPTLLPVVISEAVCAVLAISLFGLALGAVHATGAGVDRIALTYAGSQVLSGLTVLPAALGFYEGMMTGLMAVQGVAPAAAAAAALLYRVINDLFMAALGLAVALFSERDSLARLRRQPRTVAR
jgi:uncharacterized membrane protein YbhN (UPF0104 family)